MKTSKTVEMPKLEIIKSEIVENVSEAKNVAKIVASMEIESQADYEFACNAVREAAEKHDVIDAKRKSWVDPLNAVVKDINATFRPVLKAWKDTEEHLRQLIAGYVAAKEAKRTELLNAAVTASRLGKGDRAESLIEKAESSIVDSVAGVSATVTWQGEVIDAAAIPAEYLIPNVAKLNALTAATGGDPKIPGWRAFPTADLRVSRKVGK
jgi:hypothetical protein